MSEDNCKQMFYFHIHQHIFRHLNMENQDSWALLNPVWKSNYILMILQFIDRDWRELLLVLDPRKNTKVDHFTRDTEK
jgi:hypothetical protein